MDSPRSAIKTALSALKRGDGVAAERALDVALAADPSLADAWLLRGLVRDRRGVPGGVSDLRRAIALGPSDVALIARASDVLAKRGELFDARSLLEQLVRIARPDERAAILRRLGNFDLDLGWYRQGLAEYQAALALAPTSADIARELCAHLRGLGDFQAAFDVTDRFRGDTSQLLPTKAALLAKLGRWQEARAVADELAMRAGEDPTGLLRAAELFVAAGAFDMAQSIARRVLGGEPGNSQARLMLADLMTWAGNYSEARAVLGDSTSISALTIRAKISVLTRDLDVAAHDLRAVLTAEPDNADACVWRGELARLRGDWQAARDDFGRGIELTPGYPLGAHVGLVATHVGRGVVDTDLYRELLGMLEPLFTALGVELLPDLDPDRAAQRFELALAAMHGNRGRRPSFVKDGVLVPFDLPDHARFEARAIQELVRARPEDLVIARLEALARERATEPTTLCHLGEVFLWLGDYAAAESAFLGALAVADDTRWAYVGLCATELGKNRPERAVEWCARGEAKVTPGRTQYVYRGEAYRRLGDRAPARKDLLRALELNPTRLSAWLNLALLDRDPAEIEAAWSRLCRHAQALARSACLELSLDPDEVPGSAGMAVRVFEHVLVMMRGNRSSNFVTYFTRDSEIRFVPSTGVGGER